MTACSFIQQKQDISGCSGEHGDVTTILGHDDGDDDDDDEDEDDEEAEAEVYRRRNT